MASSALDSQIRVWDVATHETKVVIACPPAENWHVAFVPDSQGTSNTLAVAGGASRSVKLYDVSADGAETRERAARARTERVVLGGAGKHAGLAARITQNYDQKS